MQEVTLERVQAALGGRHRIVRLLGAGGQAKVFLAHDHELDTDVVVKVRRVDEALSLDHLRREARTLMRVVPHPNLPAARYDLVDGDLHLLLSTHVVGRDLAALVHANGDPGLSVPRVLDYLDQIAAGLDHLHSHGNDTVHGDIKPSNLLLAEDGRVVIIDFGSALRTGANGERLGTPGFTAPEVSAGDEVTPSADIYSLAAVALFLLTGQTPSFTAPAWDGLEAVRAASMERVLRRALAFDTARRPATAAEFVQQLRRAVDMEVPVGTITVAYARPTHPIASGDLRWRHHIMAALELAGAHIVTSAAVPRTDVVAAFSKAADAVIAALDIADPATTDHTPALVSLHAADLGGWRGTTIQHAVNTACDLAAANPAADVLCTSAVRWLVGDDASVDFAAIRNGFLVSRDTTPLVDGTGTDAAEWIARRTTDPLVGRHDAVERIDTAIARALQAGQHAIISVNGEAGLGKTRLLAELARRRHELGETVFVGRCTDHGGTYAAFADALGGRWLPPAGHAEHEDGWVDRRRLFGRVAGHIACYGAVTLVIDDTHWIDGSSVALLAYLLESTTQPLTVLLAARRGGQAAIPDRLTDLLEERGADTVRLAPLDHHHIAELAASRRVPLDTDGIAGVYAITGGNPFFAVHVLEQLQRSSAHTLDDPGTAIELREWIVERVNRLGADVRTVLAAAAIVGREFDIGQLRAILDITVLDAVERIETAAEAGLVTFGEQSGAFRFRHALVQAAVADTLTPPRRALMHAAVARWIEDRLDDADDQWPENDHPARSAGDRHPEPVADGRLDTLAHHWLQAGALGEPLHAAGVAARAGEAALLRLGYEQAADLARRGIALLSATERGSHRDAAEARLRVVLGRAAFLAAQLTESRNELTRGAELATRAADGEALAKAALAASLHRRHGREEPELLALIERAVEQCPDRRADLRALLQVRRARLLPAGVPHEQRCDLARLGLHDLDRLEPVDRATVEIEVARACTGPDDAVDRHALMSRLAADAAAQQQQQLGSSKRWTGVLVEALNHRAMAALQLGHLRAALADQREAARLADDTGSTFQQTRARVGEALALVVLGQHVEAEQIAHSALAASNRHNLIISQMSQAWAIARDRGHQAQLVGLESQFHDIVDENPLFVTGFALVNAEAGRPTDSRRLLDRILERHPWPRDWLWLATVTGILETAVLLNDRALIERFTADLSPYTGQWAIGGAELVCLGPVDRVLGMAYYALGDMPAAFHFAGNASDASAREGADPWIRRIDGLLSAIALEDESPAPRRSPDRRITPPRLQPTHQPLRGGRRAKRA